MDEKKEILIKYLNDKAEELGIKFPNITITTDFVKRTFIGTLYTNEVIFIGRIEDDNSITDITNGNI